MGLDCLNVMFDLNQAVKVLPMATVVLPGDSRPDFEVSFETGRRPRPKVRGDRCWEHSERPVESSMDLARI